MSDAIKVTVSFETTAKWSRDVEMTREQLDEWNKKLDANPRGEARRRIEEDMFEELGFDFRDCELDEPRLDDFYEEGS